MLIRAKYHWSILLHAAIHFALAILMYTVPREDPFYREFFAPCWLVMGCFMLVFWSGTHTTLIGGILSRRVCFVTAREIRVDRITTVRPPRKNGKWGYGMVLRIESPFAKDLILQPNHGEEFVALLRAEAPQAEFLI